MPICTSTRRPGCRLRPASGSGCSELYDRACETERDPADPDHAGASSGSRARATAAVGDGGLRLHRVLPRQTSASATTSPLAARTTWTRRFWGKPSLAAWAQKAANFNANDLSKLERRFADLKEIVGELTFTSTPGRGSSPTCAPSPNSARRSGPSPRTRACSWAATGWSASTSACARTTCPAATPS